MPHCVQFVTACCDGLVHDCQMTGRHAVLEAQRSSLRSLTGLAKFVRWRVRDAHAQTVIMFAIWGLVGLLALPLATEHGWGAFAMCLALVLYAFIRFTFPAIRWGYREARGTETARGHSSTPPWLGDPR